MTKPPHFPHPNHPDYVEGKSLARIEEDKLDERGRPPHQKTTATEGLVTVLAGAGMGKEKIAKAMKIDMKTFNKYYEEEYENGKTTLDGQALMALFQNIQKGKERSIIYYLGSRVEGFMPVSSSFFSNAPQKTLDASPDNLAAAEALYESMRKST